MFAENFTQKVEVGGEDFIMVRKLSGEELSASRQQKQFQVSRNATILGAELIQAFALMADDKKKEKAEVRVKALGEGGEELEATVVNSEQEEEPFDAEKARKDRNDQYDRYTVLCFAITSWSDKRKVSKEAIAKLTEEVSQQCFEAVLDLTVPVKSPEQVKEEAAKG